MAAARRAAVFAAMLEEPVTERWAADASALDAFCSLARACDRARVSDAALAAAATDEDASNGAAARVLLHARTLLRSASAPPVEGPVGGRESGTAFALSISAAIAQACSQGIDVIEVPRSFLFGIGGCNSASARTLRAAFADDDEALIRFLSAQPARIDVARLRAAARKVEPNPLQTRLVDALDAFGAGSERERALQASRNLDAIRGLATTGNEKWLHMAARRAVEVAGEDPRTDQLCAEPIACDVLVAAGGDAIDDNQRVNVLCDAFVRREVDGGPALVPIGASETDRSLEFAFDEGVASPISAESFARALGIDPDAFAARTLRIDSSTTEAAAQWLVEAARVTDAHTWPAQEPAVTFVAPRMTFSASRLNAYVKCPRRWFFEYLCQAVEDRPSIQALYGKVFHAALESLHRDVRIPGQWEPDAVLERLQRHLDASFGRSHDEFDSQLEYEVSRLRARRVAEHYVKWLFAEAADAPFEIAEIESRHAFSAGGHEFVGYIDRVDRPLGGGPATIFDYKTGRIEKDPAEYLRHVRSGDEAQLALYYAMRRARGEDIARVALVSLRDSRDSAWVLALDVTDAAGGAIVRRGARDGVVRAACSPDDLRASLDLLVARCDMLTRDGVDHFVAGADPPCSYCSYERACRERPEDGERIFAR